MKIKTKVLVGFFTVTLALFLVILWAIYNLFNLGDSSNSILSENYRSIIAAENMIDILERQDSGVLIRLLGEEDIGTKTFKEDEIVFNQWLDKAKDNITIVGEAEVVEQLEKYYNAYLNQVFNWESSSSLDKISLYQENFYPHFLNVRNECIKLRNLNEDTMYNASLETEKISQRAIISTVIIVILVLIFVLIFSFILSENIVRPIKYLRNASKDISKGDYQIKLKVKNKDELGQLVEEFNEMASKINYFHNINIEKTLIEKKEKEAIIDNIDDGLIVVNEKGLITNNNFSILKILKLKGPIIDLPLKSVIADKKINSLVLSELNNSKIKKSINEDSIITIIDDNLERHYIYSITSIKSNKNSSIKGVIILLKDITRLKEIEKLKDNFIMAASHELKTPLTSLKMSVDLLDENLTTKSDEKLLVETAKEEITRMEKLVRDLLEIIKLENKVLDIKFSEVGIADLFNKIEKMFKNQCKMRNIDLKIVIPENSLAVKIDEEKILLVLSNLISNALRYVKDGGEIVLSAFRDDEKVKISVKDNGIGIPKEYQTKIFDKFIQVKGRESSGSGLGLSICKEIIKAHGGSIYLNSQEGVGSDFVFELNRCDTFNTN